MCSVRCGTILLKINTSLDYLSSSEFCILCGWNLKSVCKMLLTDSQLDHNMLSKHLISHFGDMPWPPRSPDLSSCDFFPWGYLKGRVYIHKPHNLNELKVAIRQEVLTIEQQLLPERWTISSGGLKTAFKRMVIT
jgi:hypothetical protein